MSKKPFGVTRGPDFTIGPVGDLYLERWWIIPRNRWFNIYLHHFLRSDDDRALHDHPWVNCSFIIRGSYVEHRRGKAPKVRRRFSPVFRLPSSPHRVELIDGSEVWTIFVTGPTVRTWGFYCPGGWVPWRQFVRVREGSNEAGEGCGQ